MPRKHGAVRRARRPSYHGRMSSSPQNPSGAVAPPPVRDREDIDPRGKKRDRSWPPAPEALPFPVIDNHCHLDFADGDEQLSVHDHVARAAAAGVDAQITIGSDLEAVRWTAALLASEDCPASLRGGVAVHPNEAALHARGHDHEGRELVGLDAAIAEVSELLRGPGMVVVGETGLDWFRTKGGWAVLVGRMVPAVRTLISVPAGLAAMPRGRFLLLTTAGSLLWISFLTFAKLVVF